MTFPKHILFPPSINDHFSEYFILLIVSKVLPHMNAFQHNILMNFDLI